MLTKIIWNGGSHLGAQQALGARTDHHQLRTMLSRYRSPRGLMPWFLPSDYAEHHVLDGTLPDSFEEWEASARVAAGSGHMMQRIVIHAGEFSRWCAATRRNPDGAARLAFALQAANRSVPPR
jgi:hypothetical protein